MLKRILTACILLPALIALIWFPVFDWPFALTIAVLAGIGSHEYFAMVRLRNIVAEPIAGLVAGLAVVLIAQTHELAPTAAALFGACASVALVHMLRARYSIEGIAASCFAVFYLGWLPAHFVLLHGIPEIGPGLVTMLILAVALTDAAAYLCGSMIGRHKMAPNVSPNKTWEGALGGLLATLVGMAVFCVLSRHWMSGLLPEWTLARYLATGAILSAVSQIGDLTESVLKRSAGVKDSGHLFPGHGGVMDRGDGYLFAAPALYYIVLFL